MSEITALTLEQDINRDTPATSIPGEPILSRNEGIRIEVLMAKDIARAPSKGAPSVASLLMGGGPEGMSGLDRFLLM